MVICRERGANDFLRLRFSMLADTARVTNVRIIIIIIWSNWCHCYPIICRSSKIQNCLPFWCWLTQVVLEKRPL